MQEVVLEERFEVVKKLGTGRFGHIHLARDKISGDNVALKMFPRNSKELKQSDVVREYNTSRFLMSAPSVVQTLEGMFSTPTEYFFLQELSPCESLREIVLQCKSGLTAHDVKKIMAQLIAALSYIHDKDLVHRNIQAKNVLIFDRGFDVVKLSDFGLVKKEKTVVKHFDVINPYHAPELCETMQKETYAVDQSVDVWAVGILVFYCLRGRFPWEQAKFTNKSYWTWKEYVNRQSANVPQQFQCHSDKMIKFFIRTLNPKPDDRYCIKDMKKYLTISWFKDTAKIGALDLEGSSAASKSQAEKNAKKVSQKESKFLAWLSKTFNS